MDKPYIEFNSKERQPRKCVATVCELNFSVIGYFYCCFVSLNRWLAISSGWPKTHYAFQASLDFMILMSLPPEYCYYK